MTNATNNKYWLMSRESLGKVDQPGFCAKHNVGEQHEQYVMTDCHYSEPAKAIVLKPDLESCTLDMVSTEWALASPAGWSLSGSLPHNSRAHLKTESVEAGTHTAIRGANLVDDPSFILSFVRTALPPTDDQFSSQEFYFSINNHLRVRWGGETFAQIEYLIPGGDFDDPKIVKRPIQESEGQDFYTGDLIWEVYCVGNGVINIVCSAWGREPFVITDAAPVLPNKFTISGNRGGWGFHFTQLKFFSPGLVQIPDVPFGEYYDDNSLIMALWGTGGSADGEVKEVINFNNVSTNAVLNASTSMIDDKLKDVTITLYSDGYHTPYVQLWQVYAPAAISLPESEPIEITDYVILGKNSITRTSDNAPASCQIELYNHRGALTDYLLSEGRGDLIRGEIALAMNYVANVDNVEVIETQFIGISSEPNEGFPTSAAQTITLRANDPLMLFSKKKFNFPMCFLGATYDWTIYNLFLMAGIHPDYLDLGYTHAAIDVLDDPLRNYYDAPWCAEVGTNLLDFLREVLASAGLRIQCIPDHDIDDFPIQRYIVETTDVSNTVAMDFRDGVLTNQKTFGDTGAKQDTGDLHTHVLVIGINPDGKPIQSIRAIPGMTAEPGTWGYVGATNVLPIKCADLTSQDTVDKRLDEEVKSAKRPLMTGDLKTRIPTAGGLYPWERVTIRQHNSIMSDYGDDAHPFKIASITITDGEDVNPVDLALESLW
jgi:hypothetical protein